MNMLKPIPLVVIAMGMFLSGCGKQERLGQPIPSDVPTAKLAQIMKNPAAYKDKEVVLQGNYAGHCCATDFIYKEGLNGAEVYYPGFSVPQGKSGRPVKIYSIVRVRGVVKEESEKTEKGEVENKESKEIQVYLEAKGVQFK